MEGSPWFLTKSERGNPTTVLDEPHPGSRAWSEGNHCRPLVHGATYFKELYERIEQMGPGDTLYFTDWQGDHDELMIDDPRATVGQVLGRADRRGVDVRGLVWRSHWDKLSFSAAENREMATALQGAGAEVLLDMRVRTGGSHHQKLVILRHRDHPERDIAYLGGIDLCHSRRDDARHRGDPQPDPMSPEFGPTPAWHDVQMAVQGPAVHDLETVFRERWEDPTPLTRNPLHWVRDKLSGTDMRPDPLPERPPIPDPVPGGTHQVQVLRTYPNLRHGRDYPFANGGERSVARGYSKALRMAEKLVYIEDQYMWSEHVADSFVETLRDSPDLHVIAVVPHIPDADGTLSKLPQIEGRNRAMKIIKEAGGDRVAFYGLENHDGYPVYVHAKVCIIDDRWASIGSDNFNRRSWTHDSELSAAVWDRAGGPGHCDFARRLRLTLAAEHLDRELGDPGYPGDIGEIESGAGPHDLDDSKLLGVMADCVDPHGMFEAFARSAAALQRWRDGGETGPRPPGRLRPIQPVELKGFTKLWSTFLYNRIHDPDGRPPRLRKQRRF